MNKEEAQALAQAISQVILGMVKDEAVSPQKRRGRPRKKIQSVDEISNSINEPVEEILSYVPPKPTKPSYLAESKRVDFTPSTGDKKYGHQESVLKRKGKLKFVDEKSVAPDSPELKERYSQMEPHESRPAKVKIKFFCSRGNHEFEAYPSEYPQAFTRFNAPDLGLKDDQAPRVICNDCFASGRK